MQEHVYMLHCILSAPSMHGSYAQSADHVMSQLFVIIGEAEVAIAGDPKAISQVENCCTC